MFFFFIGIYIFQFLNIFLYDFLCIVVEGYLVQFGGQEGDGFRGQGVDFCEFVDGVFGYDMGGVCWVEVVEGLEGILKGMGQFWFVFEIGGWKGFVFGLGGFW